MNIVIQYIKTSDYNSLLSICVEKRDLKLRKNDILFVLKNTTLRNNFENYYCILGSGGSNIKKPNITSIAFLYLASMGIPMIKTGSTKKNSLHGSSDFFNDIGKTNFFNDIGKTNFFIDNKEYKCAYYDNNIASPWINCINILSCNKCFSNFF